MASTRETTRMALDVDRRATALGFLGALVVLGVVVVLIGVGAVLDALGRADPGVLALVVLVAAVWLTAWGTALRTVLGVLDATLSAPMAVLVAARPGCHCPVCSRCWARIDA